MLSCVSKDEAWVRLIDNRVKLFDQNLSRMIKLILRRDIYLRQIVGSRIIERTLIEFLFYIR